MHYGNVCHIAERHMNNLEHFVQHHFGLVLDSYTCSYILLQTLKDVSKHQVCGCWKIARIPR